MRLSAHAAAEHIFDNRALDLITGALRRINPVGRDGVALEDKWATGSRTYLGLSVVGFPNLFIMGGYQASFQFNLTFMLQTQGDHIAECIRQVRELGCDTITVDDPYST